MDRSSEFIKDEALFGAYPSQECVDEYERIGVRFFIDLTFSNEKNIVPYKTNHTYINYPIPDRRIPTNWKNFSNLIVKIGNILKSLDTGEKIYIHCKGGHGRSGIVVACMLCYLYNLTPSEAIDETTIYHNRRKNMKEKWRRIGSPQTRSQKHFVSKFFEPLFIYNNCNNFLNGLNNSTDGKVTIPGVGTFPTAAVAFNSFKNISKDQNDNIFKWDDVKNSVMELILKYKFEQNLNIRNNLLQTGLRPIIVHSIDLYWGKMDDVGLNILGKIISKLREQFYNELFDNYTELKEE
jgi:hypothetical protein